MSAQELSQPIKAGEAPTERAALVVEVMSYPGDDPVHWRQVVERRIQGKTRRISKVIHQRSMHTIKIAVTGQSAECRVAI